ncbi:MAG: metalloregulator ArsR/SmtB family transcription factor [Pseudomonadota bacterium]
MIFDDYIALLKSAAEPTRLRLLQLCARGELSVSDLVSVLGQSQPRVSRHLKLLCDAGLLERYRDGHWMYFRVPLLGPGADLAHRLLEPLDLNAAPFNKDRQRLDEMLGSQQDHTADPLLRRFNRLLLSYFLTHSVGDLLDVGVGSGAVLKLLAQRSTQAVGIDLDPESRRTARREMIRSGSQQSTIRPGDMHDLDFDDNVFDTVILDEVLLDAKSPQRVLSEALRVVRPTGRMLIVEHQTRDRIGESTDLIRELAQHSQLRIGSFRRSADNIGEYLVAEAIPDQEHVVRRPA